MAKNDHENTLKKRGNATCLNTKRQKETTAINVVAKMVDSSKGKNVRKPGSKNGEPIKQNFSVYD